MPNVESQGNRVNKFDASKSVTPAEAGAYTLFFFRRLAGFRARLGKH